MVVRSQPRQIVHEPLSQKYPTQNKVGGVVQVVECLPRKHEAEFKPHIYLGRKVNT
jgi:hypothetical protein